MGPSFAEIRADEIQVGMLIVASTRTGGPFEPARSWSDVTSTEHVIATEILKASDGTSLVKVVAVRKGVGVPEQEVLRFFPVDQIVQDVR